MTATHVLQQLNYNVWAYERLLSDIEKVNDDDYYAARGLPLKSIHQTLQHMFYYDAKYWHQYSQTENPFTKQTVLDKEALAIELMRYAKIWAKIWEKTREKNSETDSGAAERALGMVQHNTYHRGQLHAALSMMGIKAASLDYYFYCDKSKELSLT